MKDINVSKIKPGDIYWSLRFKERVMRVRSCHDDAHSVGFVRFSDLGLEPKAPVPGPYTCEADRVYHSAFSLEVYNPEIHDPFVPFTITLNTPEEFEIMRSIMWHTGKVPASSFYDMDWTPDREEVRNFMAKLHTSLREARPKWSKYKGDNV